jgi:hypothetical protein
MTTPSEASSTRPSPVQALAALMGFVGIFLPFASGYSPFTALKDGFGPTLAAAAFLSPLITYMALRFLNRGSLTSIERGVSWLVGAAFLGAYGWGWYLSIAEWADGASIAWGGGSSVIILFLPLLLLGFGIWITARALRHVALRGYAPILALRTMYVVNAAFALTAFFGGWQLGAWAILIATLVHLYLISSILGQMSQG